MVRSIVGTLVNVGLRKISVAILTPLLKVKK
jgi:tRNA U38,U39,U40 pseudouridine synthase TruA